MVGTNHRQALERVVLPWNGTTYLPDAGAQRITDRQGQLRRRTNHIENIERPEDLLHDQQRQRLLMIDHPGLGKLQGNIQKGLGHLVMLRQKAAWMMHIMKS